MTALPGTDIDVFPLALGGNVFGWTADRDESFRILDAFSDGGGDFIDTADSYSAWVDGHSGGESERIIGQWLARRRRDDIVVATKVGQHPQFPGLSARNVRLAAEASLERLGVEAIDVYYAHFDDLDTPLEETVSAFGRLVQDGLVRYTAVSNYSAERIREWIRIAREQGVAEPVLIQPHYNLVHREVENDIVPLAAECGLRLAPYFSLAKGFLTGKYRSADPLELQGSASPRAAAAVRYATPQGLQILEVLERVAAAHGVSMASAALAWLRAKPTVLTPIASASTVAQVAGLLAGGTTNLTAEEVADLDDISQWTPSDM